MGVNQFEAADVLNSTGRHVEIVIGRDQGGEDQILQIIQQNNSTTEEESSQSQGESGDKSSDLTDDGKKVFCFELDKVNVTASIVPDEDGQQENSASMKNVSQSNLSQNKSVLDVNDLLDDNREDNMEEYEVPGPEVSEEQPTESLVTTEETSSGNSQFQATCCPFKKRYESLLEKVEKSDNLILQLNSDLKTVTKQLVSRDKTMQRFMENVEKLINQVQS